MALATDFHTKLLDDEHLNLTQVEKQEDEQDGFLFAEMAWSNVVPMALKTTIELGVFDIIAKEGDGAKLSAKDIVDQIIETNNPEAATMLDRVLRLLASHSLLCCSVADDDPQNSNNLHQRMYSLSPVSKYFVTDADGVSLGPHCYCLWIKSTIKAGVEHFGGDMFESVPNGDVILIKHVLYDWDDENCLKVLKNCHKAIPNDGKVIVVESILPNVPEPTAANAKKAFLLDVSMMTHTLRGKERTQQDFMDLAKGSGFTSIKFVVCFSCVWVMEFYK
ncbi:hypothetical protein PIB30_048250 [Stylosanthes scabra]|uniref:Uncharacterized protein n=1 Tax=Stylosanthes scabra TaxID=79078 RepID=A0ABU6XIJ9_9FABA|nr:hypothetical protein [Stylosanthes scabra]